MVPKTPWSREVQYDEEQECEDEISMLDGIVGCTIEYFLNSEAHCEVKTTRFC